ncbi:MAG TPA: preprotein translocase subunit YajC [Oligoflexia bacterium]|nr:preprotein translocase subunit YajC [Oligoflexia bacterium]HMR24123.1 preprotein translocase subunit YajC [Oligoflexia bacterium]
MISNVYAMASNGQQAADSGNIFSAMFPMLMVFVIFYFILIRPQRKREDQHKKYLESLKKGDEVILQNGIIGKITGVTESVISLEIAQNTKIKVLRSAVAANYSPQAFAKKGDQSQ